MKYRKMMAWLCSSIMAGSVILTGCNSTSAPTSESGNSSKNDGKEDLGSFSDYSEELFVELLGDSTLNLHYTIAYPENYGLDNTTASWGEFDGSEDSEKDYEIGLQDTMDELKTFSYDELTDEEKLTYDILKAYLETEMTSTGLTYYYEPLGPNVGTQAQLPVLLAEYSFYQEQDVKNYITLCKTLPDYFDQIIQFEKEKAEKGLFMSDDVLNDVIDQCQSFVDGQENSFLYDTFETRVQDVNISDEQKQEYISQNKEAVDTGVYVAYENLISALEKLQGSGKVDGGLCNYPKGDDYYQYLIRANVGTDKSADELITMVEDNMESDIYEMRALYQKDNDIFDKVDSAGYPSSDPEEIMKQLIEACKKDFPALDEVNYEIKYVDESLEEFLSPAFYLTPPIDIASINEIYINGDDEDTLSSIYPTIAHEGYPGHLYQTNYMKEHSSLLLRQALETTGFVEGWATYVEQMSYGYMDTLTDTMAQASKVNSDLTLALYARMDLGIHHEGWDISDIQDFLEEYYGINDEEVAKEVYSYILGDPAGYLDYYIGCSEIKLLLEKAQKKSDFNLTQFHEQLLNIGPAPFAVIEKYLFQ